MSDPDHSGAVLTERRGAVAFITLNRPERMNSFDIRLGEELYAALRGAAADPDLRCVVLRGEGRAFCCGGDVREMHGACDRPAYLRELTQAIHRCVLEIRGMDKPVIAAIHGSAYGAGLSLALACDLIVASREARMNTAFLGIGLAPGCGTKFMTDLLGYHRACELVLLARTFTADEAMGMGLVNMVVDGEMLDSSVEELAGNFETMPPVAVGMAKMLLNESISNDLRSHLSLESITAARSAGTDDFAEGVEAFVEKRKPEFRGR